MPPENAIVGVHVGNQLEEDLSQQSSLPSDKLEEGTQRETMFGGEVITVSVCGLTAFFLCSACITAAI